MPVTRRTGRVDRTAKENVPADPEDMASSLANDFDPPPQQPTRRRGGAVSVSSATRSAAQAPLAESASSSSTSPMPPPSRRAMVRGGDRPALAQVNTADGSYTRACVPGRACQGKYPADRTRISHTSATRIFVTRSAIVAGVSSQRASARAASRRSGTNPL